MLLLYFSGQSEEEFHDNAYRILCIAINKARHDPFFNMFEDGLKVQKILNCLNENDDNNSEVFKKFALFISEQFYRILKQYLGKSSEKLFSQFYAITVDEKTFTEWKKCLSFLPIAANNDLSCQEALLQFILDKMLTLTIAEINEKAANKDKKVMKRILDKEEHQTLYYVAGYMIYSLKKQLQKNHKIYAHSIDIIISSWGSKDCIIEEDENSFSSYSKNWVDRVNRGGLLKVSETFFAFVKELELSAIKILNVNTLIKYCGENLKTLL